jgi:hypothetical protein
MPQAMVHVRMRRTIDQCPVVLELLQGEIYQLPAETAHQLIDAGSCELADAAQLPRLEAAALAPARRRG